MVEETKDNKMAILIIITSIILIAFIIIGLVYYTKNRNENRKKTKMELQNENGITEDRIEDPFLNQKQIDKAMNDLSNELKKK